jgi:hypothetical protein
VPASSPRTSRTTQLRTWGPGKVNWGTRGSGEVGKINFPQAPQFFSSTVPESWVKLSLDAVESELQRVSNREGEGRWVFSRGFCSV